MPDIINRFENAAIARSWAGAGRPEETFEIEREYRSAKADLVEQFAIFSGHSDQAADVANVLAIIEGDPDSDIVVQTKSRCGWSNIVINHAKTELLSDILEGILAIHGRPFGQA